MSILHKLENFQFCKKFLSEKKIPEEELTQLLEVFSYLPYSLHSHFRIFVLHNEEKQKKIQDLFQNENGEEGSIQNASHLFFFSFDDGVFYEGFELKEFFLMYIQTMFFLAQELHIAFDFYKVEEREVLARILGIEEPIHYGVSFGYPALHHKREHYEKNDLQDFVTLIY